MLEKSRTRQKVPRARALGNRACMFYYFSLATRSHRYKFVSDSPYIACEQKFVDRTRDCCIVSERLLLNATIYVCALHFCVSAFFFLVALKETRSGCRLDVNFSKIIDKVKSQLAASRIRDDGILIDATKRALNIPGVTNDGNA